MNQLRNLLVAGLNHLIAEGHVKLDHSPVKNGYTITKLFDRTTAILWTDIGHEEVRVSVWWDYDHSQHPQAERTGNQRESFETSRPLARKTMYPKFVGVVVSGWFERKEGFYLQGKGASSLFDTYVRTRSKEALAALPKVEPNGFAAEGTFHM